MRTTSPLQPASDAIVVDTTDRSVADIVSVIVDRYRERMSSSATDGSGGAGEQ
jgi:cytidylate kinase